MNCERLQQKFLRVDASLVAALYADYVEDTETLLSMLESLNLEATVDEKEQTQDVNSVEPSEEDSAIEYLQSMFPSLGRSLLKRKLAQYGGSVDKVTDDLLNHVAFQDYKIDDEHPIQVQDFTRYKKKTKRNKNAAIVETIPRREGAMSTPLPNVFSGPKSNERVVQTTKLEARATVSRINSCSASDPDLDTVTRLRTAQLVDNIDDYTRQVGNLRSQANDMFVKSKSNHLYRSAAGVYSQRAEDLTQRRNELLTEQFRRTVKKQATPYSVDFHGVPLETAIDLCPMELENWWTREVQAGRGNGLAKPFRIITGKGLHSERGIPKIKNAIRKLLNSEWRFQEHSAHFEVQCPKVM